MPLDKEKLHPIACGVWDDDLRPHIVMPLEQGRTYPLWYYETFNEIDDALEYLKKVYKEGIDQKDINVSWLELEEFQKLRSKTVKNSIGVSK